MLTARDQIPGGVDKEMNRLLTWAVCYTTQESPIPKWAVVLAENARAAAEYVRKQNSLCNICEVYKQQEAWRWR